MFKILLPAFSDELIKIAFQETSSIEKADIHFSDNIKNWGVFEKNLKSKEFQKTILQHPKADSRLKRYVKNFGSYLNSKDIVGKVSSRTGFKNYTIKRLPSGRLGCNCKDWQYNHSTKSSDCFHIKDLQTHGLEKNSTLSNFNTLIRGGIGIRYWQKGHEEIIKGQIAKDNLQRLYSGTPLRSYDKR